MGCTKCVQSFIIKDPLVPILDRGVKNSPLHIGLSIRKFKRGLKKTQNVSASFVSLPFTDSYSQTKKSSLVLNLFFMIFSADFTAAL